jgi:PadR family transcriptional regulator PadR
MAQLFLREFEQLVLSAVLMLGEQAYGMTIHEQVEKFVGRWRVVSLGAVYTTLDRLEKKGMVSSWYGDPTPERGGRSKRYFKIEAAGELALKQALKGAANMTEALRVAGVRV